jgi:hypothetical protein
LTDTIGFMSPHNLVAGDGAGAEFDVEQAAALTTRSAQSFVRIKNERLELTMMSGSLLRWARAHQSVAPPEPSNFLNLSNPSNLGDSIRVD